LPLWPTTTATESGWQADGAVRLAERFRSDGLVRRGLAPTDVTLPPARAGIAVDLLGRQLDRVTAAGQIALTLSPWEIRSVVLS
jgi:hypothetical protein